MNFLILNKKIYTSKKISGYGLATCCAIKSIMNDKDDINVCTTVDILAYRLTGKFNVSRRFISHIRQGLDELAESSFVRIVDQRAGLYLLDCSGLGVESETEFYSLVRLQEVVKIFQTSCANKFLLLKYFVCLIGALNSNIDTRLGDFQSKRNIIGTFNMETLLKLSECSQRTQIEYNKILEDSQLLYIHRENDLIVDGKREKLKRFNNIYGRFEDKLLIEAFAKRRREEWNNHGYDRYVKNSVVAANEKRKLAQKYNQLLKGNAAGYSREEIQEIYDYVLFANEKYRKLYEKNGNKDILDKIRNTEVFDGYDFLKNKA